MSGATGLLCDWASSSGGRLLIPAPIDACTTAPSSILPQGSKRQLYWNGAPDLFLLVVDMTIGGYAVMQPRPGLATYESPISWMISSIVFRMRPGRYCWTKSWCG